MEELEAYAALAQYGFLQEFEILLMDIGIECIEIVLPYAEFTLIDDTFVQKICSLQIAQARKIWANMSEDDKNLFIHTVIPEFSMTTIDYFAKFFGIIFQQ